jgi:hypothetical protein
LILSLAASLGIHNGIKGRGTKGSRHAPAEETGG